MSLVSDVVRYPDSIDDGVVSRGTGHKLIRYGKRIGNEMFCVEKVRTGRKVLMSTICGKGAAARRMPLIVLLTREAMPP